MVLVSALISPLSSFFFIFFNMTLKRGVPGPGAVDRHWSQVRRLPPGPHHGAVVVGDWSDSAKKSTARQRTVLLSNWRPG